MGRRGGGVLLYVKDTIPAYAIQLREEADCEEAIWCKLVTGHKTVRVTWGKAPPRGKAPHPSNYEFTYASGSIS